MKTDVIKARTVGAEIAESYIRARAKHAPMQSAHEGYAILLEELAELFDEIRAWQPSTAVAPEIYDANLARMRREAMHVGAMAAAFVIDVCDGGNAPPLVDHV